MVRRTPCRGRRGTVLITATWILIAMAAVALVLAQRMRVETLATGNRLAFMQADGIERGAEQYVIALVAASSGDPSTVLDASTEGRAVGDGYFWIIRPDYDNPQSYAFGIADEAAKLNLNIATADMLVKLPGLTGSTELAASIVSWRTTSTSTTAGGSSTSASTADEAFYLQPTRGYRTKGTPFESVEELLLVRNADRNVDADLLFGYDKNHNATIDAAELAEGGMGTQINAAQDTGRGIFPFVTVHSAEPGTTSTGTTLVNVNDVNVGRLRTLLQNNLSADRADAIMTLIPTTRPFANTLDFYVKVNLTSQEFAKIANQITTTTGTAPRIGLVNVNTAPRQMLACLPGLDDSDAQALIAKRLTGVDTSSIAWVVDAISKAKAVGIGSSITHRSYQFSADIIAASGDGRAFKRTRIIVDNRQSPPRIVYRKELTDLGWPLDPTIRDDLRNGQTPAIASPGLKMTTN